MQESDTNTEYCPTNETELPSESKKSKYELLWLLLLLIPVAAIIIRLTVGSVIIISGPSMEPTFYSGDVIFGTFVKEDTVIEVGDIIVFEHEGRKLVKRVASVPGDTISANEKLPLGRTLDIDEYYVLGDNTDHSTDSRDFGPIHREAIKYKYAGIHIKQPWKYIVIIVGGIIIVCKLVKLRRELPLTV